MSEEILTRLERLEAMLGVLVERQTLKDWYTVEEFARIVGRAEFTCREWCRRHRINAVKKDSGRGAYASWAISHAELLRFQREGLLRPFTNGKDDLLGIGA
jgi:Helix-turn-helix domain